MVLYTECLDMTLPQYMVWVSNNGLNMTKLYGLQAVLVYNTVNLAIMQTGYAMILDKVI